MFRPLLAIALLGAASFAVAQTPESAPVAPEGKTFEPLADLGEVVKLPRNAFETVPGKDPNKWSIVIEPYVWAIGVNGTATVDPIASVNLDIGPGKVIQHLNWGVFGKGEVRKGRWGLLADGFFADLDGTGIETPGPLYSNASVAVQQGFASLALAFRVLDDRRWFLDVYAGARYNYFGITVTATPDSAGIENVSTAAVDRIATGIGQRIDSFLTNNGEAIADAIQNAIFNAVSNRVLENYAGFPSSVVDSLTPKQINQIIKAINNSNGEYREFIAATIQAKMAAAKNQLTTAIQNRVAQAKQNLAQAVAEKLEDELPQNADGSAWWVDPIVGLRGQVNFTRWLFLSAQGDAGGFGAGSQMAWNVQASLGVNITRHLFAEVGYRFYYVDYQGQYITFKGGEAGVFAGVGVRY